MLRLLTASRARSLFWVTLLAVSALAFLPDHDVAQITTGWDKANHTLAFGALALFAGLGWPRWPWWQMALALIGYGVLVEVVQYFVGRDASALDVLADSTGIALHGAICLLSGRRTSAPA